MGIFPKNLSPGLKIFLSPQNLYTFRDLKPKRDIVDTTFHA